jgi:hypothetical protein
MRKILLVLFALAALFTTAFAQPTVGVLKNNDPLSQDGYNLFYPFDQPSVFLIDNCGRIVNEWADSSNFRAGAGTHITESGLLLRCKRDVVVSGDPIWAGGGGETVELLTWEGTLRWTFTLNDSLHRLHHDALVLPNGNVLMIVWEKKTAAEAIAAGRDTSLLPAGELWPDYLLEVTPIGTDSFTVAWEWHTWDHLIQDHDSTKANFGVVADHPELIDINLDGAFPVPADWMHLNALHYNEETDQIIFSSPALNEIYIIDHSTTLAEAAGHVGGLSNIGGDLMWRWGSPANYGATGPQQLFFQHDAHWMDMGLPPGHPDRSKIMVFNNRAGSNFSNVHILAPVFDTYEWEYLKDTATGAFYPTAPSWTYQATVATDFYSPLVSSAQRLPNGNTLIFSGQQGWAFEITPAKETVWEYEIPFKAGVIATQGDTITSGANMAFTLKRYMPDYPGFVGHSLAPRNYIEINPDTSLCVSGVWVKPAETSGLLKFYPNPAQDRLVIEQLGEFAQTAQLLDGTGRAVRQFALSGATQEVDLSNIPNGLYILLLDHQRAGKLIISR